eukprot:TRINITY_DN26248_c0_g1_i1.p1 TRINITY_DN26248_c0_g1~~TRINITY_DN26248_c0_g1_i1.p1  ORF type:complete len:238 (+),score=44.42 TRINITY_DN26248_c0_g1_i1:129-842(+)
MKLDTIREGTRGTQPRSIRPVGKLPMQITLRGGAKGLLYSETGVYDAALDDLNAQIKEEINLHKIGNAILLVNEQILRFKRKEYYTRKQLYYRESLHRRKVVRDLELFHGGCRNFSDVQNCESIHRKVVIDEELRILNQLFRHKSETLQCGNVVVTRLRELAAHKALKGSLKGDTPQWISSNPDIVSPDVLRDFKRTAALQKALSRWQATEEKERLSLLREQQCKWSLIAADSDAYS